MRRWGVLKPPSRSPEWLHASNEKGADINESWANDGAAGEPVYRARV
jgi:hypothetical protein